LDELQAHRLLEAFDETMTVREMRTYLRQHGAIGDRVKNVPLTHWWIAKYKVDWNLLVNASQGGNEKEIQEAQRLLAEVQAAVSEATARATDAANRLREALAAESAAKTAAEEVCVCVCVCFEVLVLFADGGWWRSCSLVCVRE
jgi:hypothetical protein